MIIIFGQRNFGKVDHVPGACYVVTKFFHLYFVPLIPLGSYVVVEGSETGNTMTAKSTSLSLKSIGAAWMRYVLSLGVLLGAIFGFFAFVGGMNETDPGLIGTGVVLGLASVASGVLFWASYRLFKPSHQRALELADELGLPASCVEKCMPSHGRENDHSERDRYDYNGCANRDYDCSPR
jgi:hypothetical protein